MANDVAEERRHAHELLDMVSGDKIPAIRGLLEVLVEPLARSLANAPIDSEELTPEAAEAFHSAGESIARGEGIPHEEVLREFGIDK